MDWAYSFGIVFAFLLGVGVTRKSWINTIREYGQSADTPMHVDGQFYYVVPEHAFNLMRNQLQNEQPQ